MQIKKKDNRGGLRKNNPGGRPKKGPKSFSDKVKGAVMAELDRREAKGESYGKLLVDLAFDEKAVHSLRGIALKLIAEVLVVKETKQTIEDKHLGPRIGLPPVMEKPVMQEKKEEMKLHG